MVGQHPRVVEILLKHHANQAIEDSEGQLPLEVKIDFYQDLISFSNFSFFVVAAPITDSKIIEVPP